METNQTVLRKPTIDYIQILRAIAAVMVVLCHARDFLKGSAYEDLAHSLFWPGAFGVDLFFIISGFIIVYTSYDYSRNDTIKFLKKRFFRVWPLYFILTAIYVLVVMLTDTKDMNGFSYNPSGREFEVLNIIKSLSFIPLDTNKPIYFGVATLFVGWTLNYEIYFYLVCAAGLLFSRYKYWFYGLWFVLTLIVIPAHLGLINKDRPFIEGYGYYNLMMQSLVWEFVFGAVIAIMFRKNILNIERKNLAIPIIILGISSPVYAYITQHNAGHGITHSGLYFCIMFFALALCHKFISKHIKFPKSLLLIGNASYSLYLTHPITFIIVFKLKSIIFPDWSSASFSFLFTVVVASIFISIMSYNFIEKKISALHR